MARNKQQDASALNPLELLRWAWTQLTSMRTALVLLFTLALAAIPGSLVPQRSVSPVGVSDFIAANPTLGPIYDRVGLFSVYTSVWFSAIYLLLFVSLIGCILPRTATFVRALRAAPPKTPRHLSRLPVFESRPAGDATSVDVLDRAEEKLRKARYRVVRDPSESDAGGAVRAERGYLREAGNVIFHISLVFLLVGVAIGGLFGFRGSSLVLTGQGFSNNLSQYDDLSAGAAFSDGMLRPFTVRVKDFDAQFETGQVQTGAARVFKALVEVTEPGRESRTQLLEVNHPLTIGGTSVHLIAHGYAPIVTVLDGDGNVAFSGPVAFLPQDGNFSSAGSIKAPDGRPERLAFQGFFLPTAVVDEQGPRSVFPDAVDPALFLNAWSGPPKVETGEPENVYTLDTRGLTQIRDAKGEPVRLQLRPGQAIDLPDGKGTIRMDGWTRWVKLQISETPGLQLTLAAVVLAVTGLCLSLFIRPRRIWVRTRTADDGTTTVELGGLDRAGTRTGLDEDLASLADELAGEPEKVSVP
ncbi:cytochrome c biogenesis protein ResB [Microlunatus speluncae]|uniref:cytochrome c biogenesis protein ResB n=1 Tax=Microlunatus speluncae TaxID=2594267 RepID=UPI0012665B48|nr:cytochrome c biogenesis protein ResB [Microlunatus speluncae]